MAGMALPPAMPAPPRPKTNVEVGLVLDIPGRAGPGYTFAGVDLNGNYLLTKQEGDQMTAIKLSADTVQNLRDLPQNVNRKPPIGKLFNAGQSVYFKEGEAHIHGYDGVQNRYLVSGTINGKFYQTWVDGDKINRFAFDMQGAAPELIKALGLAEIEKTKLAFFVIPPS